MPNFDKVKRQHVLQALAEHDNLGAGAFRQRYGFGPIRDFVILHEDQAYDSKAVLGAAHRYATGTPARSGDIAGGKSGAAKILAALDFEILPVEEAAPAGSPATGEWRDAADLEHDESRSAWALAARDVLIGVAGQYHSVITHKELSTKVQHQTGIRTSQGVQHWIGDVLSRVSQDCSSRDEPNLSSLCVNAQGSVGVGYAAVMRAETGSQPDDVDDHAAQERLNCYRHFNAAGLPSSGGASALTPQVASARSRSRKAAHAARPIATCPACFMALPATGVCDNCG